MGPYSRSLPGAANDDHQHQRERCRSRCSQCHRWRRLLAGCLARVSLQLNSWRSEVYAVRSGASRRGVVRAAQLRWMVTCRTLTPHLENVRAQYVLPCTQTLACRDLLSQICKLSGCLGRPAMRHRPCPGIHRVNTVAATVQREEDCHGSVAVTGTGVKAGHVDYGGQVLKPFDCHRVRDDLQAPVRQASAWVAVGQDDMPAPRRPPQIRPGHYTQRARPAIVSYPGEVFGIGPSRQHCSAGPGTKGLPCRDDGPATFRLAKIGHSRRLGRFGAYTSGCSHPHRP